MKILEWMKNGISKNHFHWGLNPGYPLKELKSEYGTPPFRKCELCKNVGLCLNDETHHDYDSEFSDYLDCINYLKPTANFKGNGR